MGKTRRPGVKHLTRRQALGSMANMGLALGGLASPLTLTKTHPTRSGRGRTRPPNILVILSDNHRWDAMGIMGHPFVRTPALDRLSREGALFTNGYCTTPLCSPARASFLTGLYAYRHHVLNNAGRSSWSDEHVSFLELLQAAAGYATAFIGKWHMPGSGLPRLRGVDRFVTFTIHGGQGRYFDCPLVVDGKRVRSHKRYITEELTDRAIAFIDKHRARPFCVYLSHKAVHHPWQPPPDLEGLYAKQPVPLPSEANSWTGFTNGQIWGGFTRPIPSAYRAYMETVTAMDREIGRLLEHVARRGLLDDTIVVYTSDNGFLFGEHKRVELRWPFEEVIRIPFIVRYPQAVAKRGRRRTQMALNIDLAPTLHALAGLEVPENMDGMSLLPALRDPGAHGRRAWLVEYYRDFPHRVPAYQGVHTDRYLYVEYQEPFPPTLHDVLADPEQRHDLMGTPEAARAVPRLQTMLAALRAGKRFDA
ncbi:MAG: sulfatase-like hydrolase/transferase [Candidatus Binatia bacterium]